MFKFLKNKIVIKNKLIYIEVDKIKRFKNCVCVITGSTGAIGNAIAHRLSLEGAIVILTGRNEEKLIAQKKQLSNIAKNIDYYIMDITKENDIQDIFEKIGQKYNKIDILINNAGFSARTKKTELHNQSIDNIDNLLSTNLRGAILTSKFVIPYMKKSDQGRIIHIASIVGIQGKPMHAEYAAAKAGLFGLMKSQALEVGKYGITVNSVSPGLVPRQDASLEKLENFTKTNCLNKICSQEDISNAVIFIASKEADFITGQNISVDGGRSLGLMGD